MLCTVEFVAIKTMVRGQLINSWYVKSIIEPIYLIWSQEFKDQVISLLIHIIIKPTIKDNYHIGTLLKWKSISRNTAEIKSTLSNEDIIKSTSSGTMRIWAPFSSWAVKILTIKKKLKIHSTIPLSNEDITEVREFWGDEYLSSLLSLGSEYLTGKNKR